MDDLSSLKETLPQPSNSSSSSDRIELLKAFEESKAGVKGLADSGISKLPKIFVRPPHELQEESKHPISSDLQVPVISLSGIDSPERRGGVVTQVRQASKELGFFIVVNHGISTDLMDDVLGGIKGFHEMDLQEKHKFYSREVMKKVKYASNVDLYRSSAANWRDTLTISLQASDELGPDELPQICRDAMIKYIEKVTILAETLLSLLSEALGLKPNHLVDIDCTKGRTFVGHYYPPCPEPDLTMGTSKHTDPSFLTILLQDQIGGLQVLHGDRYIDVQPIEGSLVVNIGNILQMVSNDEFISADHRVVANRVGPRISLAAFFTGSVMSGRVYGPIEELVASNERPRVYRDFTIREYLGKFFIMEGGIQALTKEERIEMAKAFDDTKAGVKGLFDSGLLKLPKIFIRPSEELDQERGLACNNKEKSHINVPVIDLAEIGNPKSRRRVVGEVGSASETWGFFQIVNHGIPSAVLEGMIDGVKRFNEMDLEEKKKYYTRDHSLNVRFLSNYDLFTSKTANWRDTLSFSTSEEHFLPQDLPESCRDITIEYSKHVKTLGNNLLQLLAEGLGLDSHRLIDMEIAKGHRLHCHYYPACPEPELAIGTTKHSDAGFLTILLQNHIKGLQILRQGQWVDIEPNPNALVINIGDLLQLVSNGKFKSVVHRVLANDIGPRITVAYFISGANNDMSTVYGPIKELISEENPAVYRDVKLGDYVNKFLNTSLEKFNGVDDYKL